MPYLRRLTPLTPLAFALALGACKRSYTVGDHVMDLTGKGAIYKLSYRITS